METVEVGQEVRDLVTGFQGVVVARTEWLFGCVRVGIQPRKLDDDGEPRDTQWVDEPQVEVVGTGMSSYRVASAAEATEAEADPGPTGGPMRATGARQDDPGR